MKLSKIAFGTAIAVAAASMPAQAQTSWNLGTFGTAGPSAPAADQCRYNNTSVGNAGTCDATGASTQQLTIRGYSFSNSSSSLSAVVAQGTLNTWGASGIGMCNTEEASACSSPNHAVDNYGTFTDFIVFGTSNNLALKSVSFGWTNGDADFTVLRYTGAGDPVGALNGATMSALLGGGWSVVGSVDGAAPGTYNSFNNGGLFSKYWIVASYNTALHNGGLDGGDDAFKISGVSGDISSGNTVVPEPSTYALMTAGLLALFGAARRRRRA
jgi:hypothetical protein